MVRKAALALIVAVMFSGCGGTSKPSATSRPQPPTSVAGQKPISAPSAVAQAEAICAHKAVHARVPLASSDGVSLVAIARERARTARELAAVNAPVPLATGFRRLASLITQQANLYRQLAGDTSKSDDIGALAVERKLRESPVAKEALVVGLAECA